MSNLTEQYGELFEHPEEVEQVFKNPAYLVNLIGSLIEKIGPKQSAIVLLDYVKKYNEQATGFSDLDSSGDIAPVEMEMRQWTCVEVKNMVEADNLVQQHKLKHWADANYQHAQISIQRNNGVDEYCVFIPPVDDERVTLMKEDAKNLCFGFEKMLDLLGIEDTDEKLPAGSGLAFERLCDAADLVKFS